MRAFICSLAVLVALSATVIANAIYVNEKAEELTAMLSALPESPVEADLSSIREKWEEWEPIISLTVSHKETEEIADTLAELEARWSAGDLSGYESAKEKLLDLAKHLSESETLSLGRIF